MGYWGKFLLESTLCKRYVCIMRNEYIQSAPPTVHAFSLSNIEINLLKQQSCPSIMLKKKSSSKIR